MAPHLKRLIFAVALLGLISLAILFQYGNIMLFQPSAIMGSSLRFPLVERGSIVDRNGRLLAISTKLHSVTAWIPNIKDKEQTAIQLGRILEISVSELLQKFQDNSGFLYIKRKISPHESQQIVALKDQGMLQGVTLEPEYGRSYPEKQLAAQVIGYVGTDNTGLAGIEYTYNDALYPPEISKDLEVSGHTVMLTLDINLQYFVQEISRSALEENQADSINILVMEAKSGEILVMDSQPGYDPNFYQSYPEEARRNRPVVNAYEPGSVFKIFSVASLLDSESINTTQTFPSGYYEKSFPSGETIRIRSTGNYGLVDALGILKYSSNAGVAYASDLMPAANFETYLRAFGFGQPTGIPLVGESSGILTKTNLWSARTKPTIALGQEIGVSAVQMVSAGNVLANQGILLKPLIVKKILNSRNEVLVENTRTEVRRVLKPQTASQIIDMLKVTVEEGTGMRARVQGIELAGKTGTAQVLDPVTTRYSETNYIASILVYLPAHNPQYIIYVTIENPQGPSYYGGRIAAPVARQVAEKLIQYFSMVKAGDTIWEHTGQVRLDMPPAVQLSSSMPNLGGYPKRSLLPLLSQKDYQVSIEGEGWVRRQYPAPGEPLEKGMQIILELE